jgi:DNA-binding MarR family transcriptional regulator
MRLNGIENDCFLKLVASLKSGLNLSETRVLLSWFANSLEYKITNQQIAFELSMQSSNVSRELASICEKGWLVGKEVRRNKWEQPVIMYYLHPKRLEQIREMVVEYTSASTELSQNNIVKDIDVPKSDTEQQSDFEKKFNKFVKKYNLRDRESRKDHGNDVCQYFFLEIKNQILSLEELNRVKSKYIGLFCHKGKMISDEQFAEGRSQLANCWDRNLEVVLGENTLRSLRYVPNNDHLSLIRSAITEDDYLNAFTCQRSSYPNIGFEEFKHFYIRDLDIEMQEGTAKDVLVSLQHFLDSKLHLNKTVALSLKESLSISKSDKVVGERSQSSNKREAITDEYGVIRTEHLVSDMPDEDDEGDPYYIPPEDRLNLKPEEIAPMTYDEDFCKLIGADTSKYKK